MTECPHGIAAGTCTWCLAETLDHESKAIEDIRAASSRAETAAARRREDERRRSEGKTRP